MAPVIFDAKLSDPIIEALIARPIDNFTQIAEEADVETV